MTADARDALARFMLEHHPEPVFVLDGAGKLALHNQSAKGADPDLLGLFEGRRSDARIGTFLDELRHAGTSFTLVASEQGRLSRLEGARVGEFFVVIARAVPAPREVEEELRQLRSRASLGLVAASFIHDFNNLLTPILLLGARLARSGDPTSETAMLASEIHAGTTIAASLTRDLLALARPRVPTVERLEVDETILDLRRLVQRLLGVDIDVAFALDGHGAHVEVDKKRLEHAILNLVINARDALPEGGQVTISTALVEEAGHRLLALSVRDTGVGMSEEVRAKVLEGHFTTKASSGGMGLGLTSVQRFARESGGSLAIRSEVGVGTEVTILLEPIAALRVARKTIAHAPTTEGGGELVLVADRDERVRRSIKLVLDARGYQAEAVGSRDAALEAAAIHPFRVALVDAALVRGDATSFLQRLRALAPHVRVVVLSDGHPSEEPAQLDALAKPFDDEALVSTVRRAMD